MDWNSQLDIVKSEYDETLILNIWGPLRKNIWGKASKTKENAEDMAGNRIVRWLIITCPGDDLALLIHFI